LVGGKTRSLLTFQVRAGRYLLDHSLELGSAVEATLEARRRLVAQRPRLAEKLAEATRAFEQQTTRLLPRADGAECGLGGQGAQGQPDHRALPPVRVGMLATFPGAAEAELLLALTPGHGEVNSTRSSHGDARYSDRNSGPHSGADHTPAAR
jgi:hypothetical protein